MVFGLGPKVLKHCPQGHVMQMTWRTCPRCTGQKARDEVAGRDMADATVILGASPVKAEKPAPPPDWVAQLTVTAGAAAGSRFDLKPGRWKVGRAPREEPGFERIALDEPGLSRDHFVLEAGAAAVILRDLGSTNGTFVNGNRVERHVLQEGDVVQAGATALHVRLALRHA